MADQKTSFMERRSPLLSPALLLGALVVAACWSVGSPPRAQSEGEAFGPRSTHPVSVLLITIDTLRADHLGAYGYGRRTSPHIDRLAADGLVFTAAYATYPRTGPSLTALHTGAFPIDLHAWRIDQSAVTLAESLRAQGYTTAAAVDNANLSREHGYAQGFDTFRETWQESTSEIDKTHLITETGIERIGNLQGRPFFVWLHYVNPHGPYAPPVDYARPFLTDQYFDPRLLVPRSPYPPGDDAFVESEPRLAPYVANYDGEVSFADAEIGRVLDFLAKQPGRDDTLVIVTADHGENLGEAGCYFMHGPKLTEATLRVPLIVSQPGHVARARVAAPVQLIDVVPTILDWVGVAKPRMRDPPLAGQSLVDLDPKATASPHAYLFFASNEYWGVRRRDIKVILQAVKRPVYPGPETQMFDIAADPGELRDVFPTREIAAGTLIEVLQRRRALHQELVDSGAKRYEDLSEDARANLRSLGYIR